MNREKRDRNQVDLRQRMPFLAAGFHYFHVEDPAFSEAAIRFWKHPRDVRKAQPSPLPEEPAQWSIGEVAQANVSFSGGFSNAALPARNRHGRHTYPAAESFLAKLASLAHVLNLVRPLGNDGIGFLTHSLSPNSRASTKPPTGLPQRSPLPVTALYASVRPVV